MMVRMMLKRIDVPRGKKNSKLSLLMWISPGSFPR